MTPSASVKKRPNSIVNRVALLYSLMRVWALLPATAGMPVTVTAPAVASSSVTTTSTSDVAPSKPPSRAASRITVSRLSFGSSRPASSTAVTLTVWGSIQVLGVKVSVAGCSVTIGSCPAGACTVIVTVTADSGRLASRTMYSSLWSSVPAVSGSSVSRTSTDCVSRTNRPSTLSSSVTVTSGPARVTAGRPPPLMRWLIRVTRSPPALMKRSSTPVTVTV